MKRPLQIVEKRKWWFALSGVLILATVALIAFGGLKFGIDFAGGTLHEISFTEERPNNDIAADTISELVGDVAVQPTEEKGMILRYRNVDNATRQQVLDDLSATFGEVTELRFESIGPVIGQELRSKALWALSLIILAIIIYLTYAFRRVSRPVQSWKYGLLAIVTLLHDVTLVTGAFAVLGFVSGAEINSLFVIALLTTLGYSVHDTIVVFDRTRSNLLELGSDQFVKAVSLATNQTLVRSINTSVTTAIPLLALLIFGGASLQSFILTLLAGVAVGTYSSIFIASPLLVATYKWSQRRGKRV